MKNKIILSLILLGILTTFSCVTTDGEKIPRTNGTLTGIILDSETGLPLEGVTIRCESQRRESRSETDGSYSLDLNFDNPMDIMYFMGSYGHEFREANIEINEINLEMTATDMSAASLRWERYLDSSEAVNSIYIPDNPQWNVSFEVHDLKGDLAPDPAFIRRDPSGVLEIDGLYYVWYTKGSGPSTWFRGNQFEKVFPWDLCDIWYATSSDGITWDEKGPAVERGPEGSFDDRSAFTPEIFVHEGKYYLLYQAVQAPYVIRVKNTVAMAVADSPEGPWTKLDEPILVPADNGEWDPESTSHFDALEKGDFDSHKVHDPCLLFYNDKFYLYYKGERMGEEKFFDGQREIKWGVAMADHPEGPYEKSQWNPITNTGHEVCVWPYQDGIAIIQKLDGPEVGTVQYAKDGIHFEIMGALTGEIPDAFGLFRPENPEDYNESPTAGIEWGLSHGMRWDFVAGGWMWIQRFELVK